MRTELITKTAEVCRRYGNSVLTLLEPNGHVREPAGFETKGPEGYQTENIGAEAAGEADSPANTILSDLLEKPRVRPPVPERASRGIAASLEKGFHL
jgi:hypothetical protein